MDTCRCGNPAPVGNPDLCEALCWPCQDDFDAWADANRGRLFSDWPGRN